MWPLQVAASWPQHLTLNPRGGRTSVFPTIAVSFTIGGLSESKGTGQQAIKIQTRYTNAFCDQICDGALELYCPQSRVQSLVSSREHSNNI